MGYYGNLENKQKIQKLRQQGLSYREIEKATKTSKSTISKYCKNIELTKTQINHLLKNKINGLTKASILGAKSNKNKRKKQEKDLLNQGIAQVGKLSQRDKFIAGISLYQGEGSKTGNAVELTNADPITIKFMVSWICEFCRIDKNQLKFNLWLHDNLNESKAVEFWVNLLQINASQFGRTYFAKNKPNSHKIRKNIHQFGIIKIRFYNTAKLRLILGWIKGILSQ